MMTIGLTSLIILKQKSIGRSINKILRSMSFLAPGILYAFTAVLLPTKHFYAIFPDCRQRIIRY